MAIIGVMGSGTQPWQELTEPLGRWLAEQGHDLLTGAGQGSMLAVCQAFSGVAGPRGRAIGIVPTLGDGKGGFVPQAGYPNAYVDLPILTPLPRLDKNAGPGALSRNFVNILTSDVIVALPGGPGTLDELRLAERFAKPTICFGPLEHFTLAPAGFERTDDLGRVCAFIAQHVGRQR